MTGRRKSQRIDRAKVRVQARKLDGTGLLVWLDRAIDLLPEQAFPELIANYVHLKDIVSDGRTPPDLLHTIRRFHRESMAGRYYQDFMVNSRNFMEKSRGTQNFIAEHSRLIDACMKAEQAGEREATGEGLGLLIDLMRQIDRCEVDIVFFADEAGSWQIGVNWKQVLPAWFRCLSPGAEPHEWAEAVVNAINDFATQHADAILATARDGATPNQREALAEYEGDVHRWR